MRRYLGRLGLLLVLGVSGLQGGVAQPLYPLAGPLTPLDSLSIGAFATLLSEYVQYPSVSGQERDAGEYLRRQAQLLGLSTRVLTDTFGGYNLAISLYPLELGKPNLVLLNHIDVVPAGDTMAWAHPPFSGKLAGGAIWGRGTIDAKGLAVMQLAALARQARQWGPVDLPYNVTVLCVSGEETGGDLGAGVIADRYLPMMSIAAVFGEGGSGLTDVIPGRRDLSIYTISVAEKSNLWLELDLTFRSQGHSAAAPDNYPNKAMLRALNKLSDVTGDIQFSRTTKRMFKQVGKITGGLPGFGIRHANWWVFRPVLKSLVRREPLLRSLLTNTAILTNLSNPPGPVNQIPNRVTAQLDCRLLPNTSRRRFLRDIRYGLFEPRFTIKVLNAGPEAEESSPTTPYYKAMEQAFIRTDPGCHVVPILFPGSTDNNFFRSKGIPTYGITPVRTSRQDLETIHGLNERLLITELQRGITFYEHLLDILQRPPGRGR